MGNLSLNDIPGLQRAILAQITKKSTLSRASKPLVPRMKKRTRLGNGVIENLAPTHKLKKLKTSTVKERRRLKKIGFLTGPGATPAKSGLNRTGSLLEDIKLNVQKARVQFKLGTTDNVKKAQNLKKIVKTGNRYVFMNLSNAEFKSFLKSVVRQTQFKINQLLSR